MFEVKKSLKMYLKLSHGKENTDQLFIKYLRLSHHVMYYQGGWTEILSLAELTRG